MHFTLFRTETVWAATRQDWLTLWRMASTRVPFLHPEYLQAWWEHRGGGEWPQAELCVLLAHATNGAPLGLAPLFAAPNASGQPRLWLLGGIEISDYLDCLVLPGQAPAFYAALLQRLTAPDVPAWQALDWYNLPAASATRAGLAQAAQARGWAVTEQAVQPVPAIALPDTLEAYWAMMDKKERQELRRKMRRAEGGEADMTWQVVSSDAAHLEADVEAFLDLMTLNTDKARFLTPAMRAQMRALALAAGQAGFLHLAQARVGGELAAAYLSFDDGRRLYVYNSALNPRFAGLSAGWVLLGWLIQWCIERGYRTFDFMRGAEDYKLRFGAVADHVYRLQVSPLVSADALGGTPAPAVNPQEQPVFPA